MEKKNFFDGFLDGIIEKHLEKVVLAIVVFVAVLVRLLLMPNTELSPDYNTYYLDWVNQYREYGLFVGLGKTIGDYYVPYNIMYGLCSLLPCEPYIPLTIFSMIAEFVSAYYIMKIVIELSGGVSDEKAYKKAMLVGALTLLLPFVVFNGALWKQCDAIYVVFIVIALYHLVKENYRLAFVFLAISFGFKLQAILFVPLFFVAFLVKKGFSIFEFAWVPFMYLVMGLPSVILKKGLRATYFAYLSQTNEVQTEGYGMVSYYPNIYNFGLDDYDRLLKLPAMAFTALLLLLMVIFAYRNREYYKDNLNLLILGVFMAWTMCMFLPGMHERYDYGIVLVMTALGFSVKKELMPTAIIMNISSLLVYLIVLFRIRSIPITLVSVIELAAYLYTAYYLFKGSATTKFSK